MKTVVVLPDGSELSSGTAGVNAIRSFSLTQCVNEGQQLQLGSICSAMVELELFCTQQTALFLPGQEMTVYREDDSGQRHKVGIFLAQQETRPHRGKLKIVAYDRISLLDQDISRWLQSLEQWPYTLKQLSRLVCRQCGVPLLESAMPNEDFCVQKFYADGVTGRNMLRWIGELCGRFCRCNADGQVEFAWYTPGAAVVGEGELFCYQNTLSIQDYAVAAVDRVVLRQTDTDVGTAYPEDSSGENTYVIQGNPMAAANSASSLQGIAQTLYEQLSALSYTPFRATVPATFLVSAGDAVTVRDSAGREVTALLMTKKQSGCKDTLESTGSPTRSCVTALHSSAFGTLSGKIMNLSLSVDGLRAQNADARERSASLELDVNGITLEVSRQEQEMEQMKSQMTQLRQTDEAVQIQIQSLTQNGADKVTTQSGFTFDENGLTISKSDSQMENLLNESGMYIRRNTQTLLQADQEGVTAVDVSVKNFLIVGEHARFEDYQGADGDSRTACFWI